jgi:ATP-dependent Lhr-like helicase
LKTSPIALLLREHAALLAPAPDNDARGQAAAGAQSLSSEATAVRDALTRKGASFFHEIVAASGLLPAHVETALAELAGAGIVTADSFAGLRALLARQDKRRKLIEAAGRWSLMSTSPRGPLWGSDQTAEGRGEGQAEHVARTLLKRYGIVFRSMLVRESRLPPWRDLVRVYRRLEARGEIRGGRFVAGFGGEQFASSDAVGRLRAVRKMEKTGEMAVLGAADPLNLVGVVTPEARVPAVHTNRLLLQDGLPIAALEAGELRRLAQTDLTDDQLRAMLARKGLRGTPQLHPRLLRGREAQALANRTIH